MSVESRKIDLYKEFRHYANLSEVDKLDFMESLKNDAATRSESEKADYKSAILSNLQEIKDKIVSINSTIDKHSLTHA